MANDNLMTSYKELIGTYRAIDTFRAQLLERLPLATGAGIFLLYATDGALPDETTSFLPAFGIFGFVVALGLFVYEYYGITKCTALINSGKKMEVLLGIDGQFLRRPRSLFNEPFAAGLIYPAVLAAWAYLGLSFLIPRNLSVLIAALVFLIFFAIMIRYNLKLRLDSTLTDLTLLNQKILHAEEEGHQNEISQYLHPDFTILCSNGEKQDREQFQNSIPINKDRGRSAIQDSVQMVGQYAIYTGIITTTKNSDGTLNPGRSWNTRLFVKDHDQWVCLSWQVMKIL